MLKIIQTVFLIPFLLFIAYGEECTLIQEQDFGAIGDTSGKDIYTKKEYTYECNFTTTVKGECVEWRVDSNRHMSLPKDKPVVFKDEDFSGGLGQMAMIFAGYSQLDHIWSGWKGLCYDGTIEDFSWASDPMMWASMLAQAVGASEVGGQSGASGASSALGGFKEYAGYAQCAVEMGVGIGSAMNDMKQDEIPCDPVDEFCDEKNGGSDVNVMSVTRESYEKLVTENPGYAKYIEIVSEEDGILILKIRQPKEDTSHLSATEAADALKKIKNIMLAIKTAFIAYDAYNCFSAASGSGTYHSQTDAESSGSPVQDLVTGAVSRWIASTGCVPCSIGFTLVMNLVNSFESIDSCSDKDDAKQQGERHMATYSHKKEKMCHFIRKETEDGVFTSLDKYYYCCYDDVFSRILAEQFKAQYAKNWNSCSDVTLKEITNLNFTPCKKEHGVDPATIPWDASYAERKKAWQYQEKCVDFSEMIQYLSEKFSVNINQDDLYNQLENLKDNIPK